MLPVLSRVALTGSEGKDELADIGSRDHFRSLGGAQPLALALALFLPLAGDAVDLERVDQDFAAYVVACSGLHVEVPTCLAFGDRALQACFLTGFACGCVEQLLAKLGPAFREQPPAGVTA